MADETDRRFQLEAAVAHLKTGRKLFDDLVQGPEDLLVGNLYALTKDSLRAIVFERVIAARETQTRQDSR